MGKFDERHWGLSVSVINLTSTDPDKLRSDLAAYGRKAQTKLSSAANAVSRKQQAVTAKSTQAAKSTATRVRSNPALPTVGVLAGVSWLFGF